MDQGMKRVWLQSTVALIREEIVNERCDHFELDAFS